jgi:hypothetical protein
LHGRRKAGLMPESVFSARLRQLSGELKFRGQSTRFAGFRVIYCLAVRKIATYIPDITAVMTAQSSRPSRKGLSMECLTGVSTACFKEKMTWQK